MVTIADATRGAMDRHIKDLVDIQQLSIRSEQPSTGNVLAIVNFDCPHTAGRDCNNFGFGDRYGIRLDHKRLVELGSEKIDKMLLPKQQERFRRLLKLDTLPAGVDYILDFTPPSAEDECSQLIGKLCLPPGTREWWMSAHYQPSALLTTGPRTHNGSRGGAMRHLADKSVGATLANGHDDDCLCSQTYPDQADTWAARGDVQGIYNGDWVPTYREKVKEYCPVRHRMNILRILRAIAGADLLINSATRMWTLANLADYLDVKDVVRDSITTWFLAAPNTKFIEMYPEESFKVALMLGMGDVLPASFKILVSERAVDHAAATPLATPPPTTWMGRQRTDYGDLPQDPVEHASLAFAERTKAKYQSLLSDRVYDDTIRSTEWGKLKYYTTLIDDALAAQNPNPSPFLTSLKEDLTKLKTALVSVMAENVETSILSPPKEESRLADLIAAQRAHSGPATAATPAWDLAMRLSENQRALLPFFWYNLLDHFPGFYTFGYHTYPAAGGEYIATLASTFNEHLQHAIDKRYVVIPYASYHDDLGGGYDFSTQRFHNQVEQELSILCLATVAGPAAARHYYSATWGDGHNEDYPGGEDLDAGELAIQFLMSDHLLLTLGKGEIKYLPLWVPNGNDDGTGRVFQEEVPETDMGACQPGPEFRTGRTVASSTGGGTTDTSDSVTYAGTSTATYSDLGMEGLDLGDGTEAGSVAAQDSATDTVGDRSGVASVDSDTFTEGDDEGMREAMMAVPAGHQVLGQAIEGYVEDVSDTGTEVGYDWQDDEEEDGNGEEDDDDAMDTDSTLSLGGDSDNEDDLADFLMG